MNAKLLNNIKVIHNKINSQCGKERLVFEKQFISFLDTELGDEIADALSFISDEDDIQEITVNKALSEILCNYDYDINELIEKINHSLNKFTGETK